MTLVVLPDAELLVTGWLGGADEIAALYAHVGTEIPADPVLPIVRVLRVGGTPSVRGWLDVARVQVDCYADTKQAAHDLARLAQAAMHTMTGSHDEGVVTGVDDGVFAWAPDPDTTWPAYTADYLVYLHPNPATGGA